MSFKFTEEILKKGLSYNEYRNLIDNLLAKNKTTGENHTESYVEYTRVNVHRMSRIDRTLKLDSSSKNDLEILNKQLIFIVLSEAWCGDAAWNLPAINKITEFSEHIELKILLRDEFEEVMNHYLTNGGKAIPKLICLEKESLNELFVWGPRPKEAAKIMEDYKTNPVGEKSEALANIQKWYGKDKGKTIIKEICELLKN